MSLTRPYLVPHLACCLLAALGAQRLQALGSADPPYEFVCAAQVAPRPSRPGAARPAQARGTLSALVIFARFRGEATGTDQAPPWASALFDPGRPGSFTHFYDEMSAGHLQVEGQVLPRRYASLQPSSAYLSSGPEGTGQYGRFNLEILEQADRDADFGLCDNDGPDGRPNSGDDDGYVDIVFINLLTVPQGFLLGGATGLASLGLDNDFTSNDAAAGGGFIRIPSRFTGMGGTTQRGHTFSVTASTMCHEFAHVLGLVDLFDQSSLDGGELDPERDGAGVGKWDLMGLGTLGWGVEDGPNAFSAHSLLQLGWVEAVDVAGSVEGLVIEDLLAGRRVWRIPLSPDEYFLLENRQASASYYNRNVPASGLLVWHVDEHADNDEERHKRVDLVCADGLFADRGYPGERPDPVAGLDNLDYWARDAAYAQAHNGNQGDATDPFDGLRFTRLDALANPGLRAYTGFTRNLPLGIALERIRASGGRMVVDVRYGVPLDGHVTSDTTWRGTVDLVSDVVVDPGATLTLAPATRLRFASFDWQGTGFHSGLCEVLVFGELDVQGTDSQPVVLAPTQRRGSWGGVFLLGEQAPDLNGLQISGAAPGIVRLRLPPGVTRWSGSVQVPADVVVPPGAELRVEAGTRVGLAGEDLTHRGGSAELVEVIVEGALTVAGNAGAPVEMTLEPVRGDAVWYGVSLVWGGSLRMENARITQAGYAVEGEVPAGASLLIADTEVRDVAGQGVHLRVNGEARVERTAFSRTTGAAVYAEGSGRLVLSEVTATGNGLEGVVLANASLEGTGLRLERNGQLDPGERPRPGLRAMGGRGQSLVLRRCAVLGNTQDGLDLEAWEGTVRLEEVEIAGNRRDGLRASAAANVVLQGGSLTQNVGAAALLRGVPLAVSGVLLAGNAGGGLQVLGRARGAVLDSELGDSPGLLLQDVDSLQVRGNRFAAASVGLRSSRASPRVEGNIFADNDTGMVVEGAAMPATLRRNAFTGNRVALANLGSGRLAAQGNYWGTADSLAIAGLLRGAVDWYPFLTQAPGPEDPGTAVRDGGGGVPAPLTLYPAYPNPFNAGVTVGFRLPQPGVVSLAVHDALGRLVRQLVDGPLPAGVHARLWDGCDQDGRPVASGVYLLLLQAGSHTQTRRLALVR
ncbi:MAG: right-handed parallel beta-helix repeat-containing protein [Candidatus Latescibacterota bacterium]